MPPQPFITQLDSILNLNPDTPFSRLDEASVMRSELLSHAYIVSKQLPNKKHAINLCSNRYLFMVCYLAIIIRNQINLLPANQAKNTINDLLHRYQNSYYITDNADQYIGQRYAVNKQNLGYSTDHKNLQQGSIQSLSIDPNQIVSISFTSGTTGQPKEIQKNWQEFKQSAQLAIDRLGLKHKQWTIVSTVPPQHMYGLETSFYWTLFSSLCITSERPFFPEDIRQATHATPSPCLLISTPTHLKACLNDGLEWHNIAMALSSTAPLNPQLAEQIEAKFNAPLYEIFGSTETLSFASRRPTKHKNWQPYQGISVFSQNHDYYVQGGHLQQAHKLDDQLSIDKQGFFTVTGRTADIIKIAGKRASLTELNLILNQIDGVKDGIFYLSNNERLAALVVSSIAKKILLVELRKHIDEVFLPRPLLRVAELPRNSVGKIIKNKLDKLIQTSLQEP